LKRALGRGLALDRSAESARASEPAFLSRPKGAPVYYAFEILHDVVADGFVFGAITDFERQPSKEGDAFVIAPDNGRAGLVWTVSREPEFEQICPAAEDRWGVWAVTFPFEMTSRENAGGNLEAILPELRPKWEQWRRDFSTPPKSRLKARLQA
jgi:hypothetical protein